MEITDWDEEFVNTAFLPPHLVTHMRNAVATSYYKYGSMKAYGRERIQQRLGQAWKSFRENGNHEKLVDVANYCMFLYILGDREYLDMAREVGEMYEERKYKATDNGEQLKTVSDWLREKIWYED